MNQICRYFIQSFLLLFMLVELHAQSVILAPFENSTSEVNHISVSALGRRGLPVVLLVNGVEAATDTFRIDDIVEFINIEVPAGPVVLSVKTMGTLGQEFETKRSIHVLGPVQRIIAENSNIEIEAGTDKIETLRFQVQDEWEYLLDKLLVFRADISDGEIVGQDLDTLSPGFQSPIKSGVCEINIKAPEVATRATLKIEVNGFVEIIPVMFTTSSEPFVMLGTMNATLGTQNPDQKGPGLSSLGLYERNTTTIGDHAQLGGRTAFYAKGAVRPGYHLTASFDTDRGYMDQLFADVDPDDPYPLYGDASTLVYDAQTRSKLYAKLEKNESYVLYGDYNTGLTENEFTAYNRTFNGMLANWQQRDHHILGFASLTDREVVQEEIRGQGISGYYYFQGGNITRFSEKIMLLVRDRYHSETILSLKEQTRFHDYDVNYVDGTLMFKQAVPGVDANGNPVFIVVSYEHQSLSNKSLAGGLRYKGVFKENLQIGATLISEEKASSNYYLYGLDAKLALSEQLTLKGEIAQSSDPVLADSSTLGQAFSGEILYSPDMKTSVKAYYRSVDGTFLNNSQIGRSFEGGSEKYGMKGKYTLKKRGEVLSEYYRQESSSSSSGDLENQVFSTQYQLGKMAENGLRVGYENAQRQRSTSTPDSMAIQLAHSLNANINLKLNEKLTGSLAHYQNISKESTTKPSNTSIGLSYLIAKNLSLSWNYRITPESENTHQNIIGIDSKITEHTQLTGKYEISGISSDARSRASIGLNNKWQINDDIALNIAYENAASIDSFEVITPDHQSLALAAEYLPDAPWKLVAKLEQRDDKMSQTRVSSLGGDARILAGFGIITRLDHFENSYKAALAGKVTRVNYQAGLAYRPEGNDVINILAKLAFISEENTHSTPILNQQRLIASMHLYWQPLSRFGMGARIAQRSILDEEGDVYSDRTNTIFISLRPEYAWNLKWSTAMDIRYLTLQALNQSSTGIAMETNYLLKTNMQAGLGYIFSQFDDEDFAFNNYEINNLYISLHVKFSEDIFNWR